MCYVEYCCSDIDGRMNKFDDHLKSVEYLTFLGGGLDLCLLEK